MSEEFDSVSKLIMVLINAVSLFSILLFLLLRKDFVCIFELQCTKIAKKKIVLGFGQKSSKVHQTTA